MLNAAGDKFWPEVKRGRRRDVAGTAGNKRLAVKEEDKVQVPSKRQRHYVGRCDVAWGVLSSVTTRGTTLGGVVLGGVVTDNGRCCL